jgi:hypothetical protein
MSMRSILHRISAQRFGWSAEEISNKRTTRRMWKRTWKKQERRAMKEVEPNEAARGD